MRSAVARPDAGAAIREDTADIPTGFAWTLRIRADASVLVHLRAPLAFLAVLAARLQAFPRPPQVPNREPTKLGVRFDE